MNVPSTRERQQSIGTEYDGHSSNTYGSRSSRSNPQYGADSTVAATVERHGLRRPDASSSHFGTKPHKCSMDVHAVAVAVAPVPVLSSVPEKAPSNRSRAFECSKPQQQHPLTTLPVSLASPPFLSIASSTEYCHFDLLIELQEQVIDISNLAPCAERDWSLIQTRSLAFLQQSRSARHAQSTQSTPHTQNTSSSPTVLSPHQSQRPHNTNERERQPGEEKRESGRPETTTYATTTVDSSLSLPSTSLYPSIDSFAQIPDCNVDVIFRLSRTSAFEQETSNTRNSTSRRSRSTGSKSRSGSSCSSSNSHSSSNSATEPKQSLALVPSQRSEIFNPSNSKTVVDEEDASHVDASQFEEEEDTETTSVGGGSALGSLSGFRAASVNNLRYSSESIKSRLDRQTSVPSIYFQRQNSYNSVSTSSQAPSFCLNSSISSLLGEDDTDQPLEGTRTSPLSYNNSSRFSSGAALQPQQPAQRAPGQRESFRTLQREASSARLPNLSSRCVDNSFRRRTSLGDSEHSKGSYAGNSVGGGMSLAGKSKSADVFTSASRRNGGHSTGTARISIPPPSTFDYGCGISDGVSVDSSRSLQLRSRSVGSLQRDPSSRYNSHINRPSDKDDSQQYQSSPPPPQYHQNNDDGTGYNRFAPRDYQRRSGRRHCPDGSTSFYGDDVEAPLDARPPPPPPRVTSEYSNSYHQQQQQQQQRQQQQQQSLYVPHQDVPLPPQQYYPVSQQPRSSQCLEIEISPGVFAALHGADETWAAISDGRAAFLECLCCSTNMICMSQAEYVLCPNCKVVCPVDMDGNRRNEGGGVGLGLRASDYNGPLRRNNSQYHLTSSISGSSDGGYHQSHRNAVPSQHRQPQCDSYSSSSSQMGRRGRRPPSERYMDPNEHIERQRTYHDHGSYY